METSLNRYSIYLLALILVVSFFLRFYKLESVPDGLYQDETAIGYNAYSILESGKDEHAVAYPLYFKSFGDRKLPVYIYLAAISEKLFGVNAFAVRFPSALFGSLSVLIIFLITKKITKSYQLSLFSAALLSITPWHLHFSRAGFEVNVALFFAVLGAYLLLIGKDKRSIPILLLSVLSFGLSLYSYNVTRLLSPLIALSIVLIYRRDFIKLPKQTILLVVFFIFIVILPFLITFFGDSGASSASGALITSKDIVARNAEFRGYFTDYPVISKLFLNQYLGIIRVYFENLAGIFDTSFFFIKGSSHGNQGIGTHGVFYLFQLPLILIGLKTLVVKWREYKVIAAWGILTFFVLALSKEVPHATRGYFLILPITFLTALGLSKMITYLKKISFTKKMIVATFLICIFSYSLFYYFASYYARFPIRYASSWRQQDQNLVKYLVENDSRFEKILIDENLDFVYTSYLFYSKFPPDKFLQSVERLADDTEGFSKVIKFGKIEIKNVNWETDLKKGNLIITNDQNKPETLKPDKVFFYPTRPVAVSVKEQVFQYPTLDVAYVLFEGRN